MLIPMLRLTTKVTEYAAADLTADCWDLWSAVFAGQTDRMVRVAASFLDEPSVVLDPELDPADRHQQSDRSRSWIRRRVRGGLLRADNKHV